jgi:hypothetical protein
MAVFEAIAGGASLLGGLGSFLANSSAADRAEMLQNQALRNWIGVNIPDPKDQQIALQKFVQQGELDPKLETAIKSDPSQFKDIVTSAADRTAQNRALSEIQNIGMRGGLRLQDKAALQDALLQQQTQDRANRQSIESDMARRGLGGSGFDVAARLQGQQGTSDQAARNSLGVAASAQDRALQALMQSGQLATQYRTQQFGEEAQRAAAADAVNRFNTQNLQDVQQRNIGSQNAAQAANLASRQKIADQNTAQANYEQEYNKKLLQQQYENQAQKAAGMSGQYQGMANTEMQRGQALGNTLSNIAGGASNIATTIASKNTLDDYFDQLKKKQTYSTGAGNA